MAKDLNPKKYGDYENGEIVFVIKQSAALQPIDKIIGEFNKTFKPKTISYETVLDIQADHSARIMREAEVYLKNVEGNPFAHPRLVLDMWLEVYHSTRTPRPTALRDREAGVWDEAPDDKTANSVLKAVTDYLLAREKLELEKDKKKFQLPPNPNPEEYKGENPENLPMHKSNGGWEIV